MENKDKTIVCSTCGEDALYVKDEIVEEAGFLGFDCPHCKAEMAVSKYYPDFKDKNKINSEEKSSI